jgi:anti-sigma regulatory factor (Ser/Thr protein kinase)
MRDLSLHLMDIVQNSVKARATAIEIEIDARPDADQLVLRVRDNGCGMPPEMVATVQDPFVTTRTTRSVGLGISLLKELCELTGGHLEIESSAGVGTCLVATLGLSSIDRLPLGDLGDTFYILLSADPSLDYSLKLTAQDRTFKLDMTEIRAEIPDLPVDDPAVLNWIRAYIHENQTAVFSGVLDEIES